MPHGHGRVDKFELARAEISSVPEKSDESTSGVEVIQPRCSPERNVGLCSALPVRSGALFHFQSECLGSLVQRIAPEALTPHCLPVLGTTLKEYPPSVPNLAVPVGSGPKLGTLLPSRLTLSAIINVQLPASAPLQTFAAPEMQRYVLTRQRWQPRFRKAEDIP